MIDLDWSLKLEDRLKFVEKYTGENKIDFTNNKDKQLLNLLSDYLTNDIMRSKVKTTSLENVQATKTKYITQKTSMRNNAKVDRERALKNIPQLQDYIDYRNELKRLNKKYPGWVKERLDSLREVSNEKISSEAQFFKAINDDINYCTYPPLRVNFKGQPDYSNEKILIDYTDQKHIVKLLRNYDSLTSSNELLEIKCDIDIMLEKVEMTDSEWNNLMFYMDGEPTGSLDRKSIHRVARRIAENNKEI